MPSDEGHDALERAIGGALAALEKVYA
jgi:hypothetical protein